MNPFPKLTATVALSMTAWLPAADHVVGASHPGASPARTFADRAEILALSDDGSEAEGLIDASCFGALAHGGWGNETLSLDHWCRDHASIISPPVYYNTPHLRTTYRAQVENVRNNDYTTEKIVEVVIELGHAGDANPVRTWTWKAGAPETEIELTGAHDFTTLFDKACQHWGAGAFSGRGFYSATATAKVELKKKKKPGVVADTRTLTAYASFHVIELDTAIANSSMTADDLVHRRDNIGNTPQPGKVPNGGHNFYEHLHIFCKAPGFPGALNVTVASVTNKAPFPLTTPEIGPAPATQQQVAVVVPGDPGAVNPTTGLPSASASLLVFGKDKSVQLNDETYRVVWPQDPCQNPEAAKQTITVFGYKDERMTLVPGGAYALLQVGINNLLFIPNPPPGISMQSFANLDPVVPLNQPQTAKIRIGATQNLLTTNRTWTYNLAGFIVPPGVVIPGGIAFNVPGSISLVATVPGLPLEDSIAGNSPVYSRADLAIPGNNSNTSDSPQNSGPIFIDEPVVLNVGQNAFRFIARYQVASVWQVESFRAWCVSFFDEKIMPLAQEDWDINAQEPGNLVPANAGGSNPAALPPVIGPPFPNVVNQTNKINCPNAPQVTP